MSEKETFKNSLIELFKNCDKSIQVEILDALSSYDSFEVIESIIPFYDTTNARNLEHLILALRDIKPNSELSLRYFIDGTKKKLILSREGLYKVTDVGLTEQLVQNLTSDDVFLDSFLYFESIFEEKESKLIENVKNAINDSLVDKINDFIFKIYKDYKHYGAVDSKYAAGLLDLLKTKKPDAIFDFLSKIKNEGIELNNSRFDKCFESLITEHNVEDFINEIEQFKDGRWYALSMFLNYPPESNIYKKGMDYLSDEYSEYKRKREEYAKKLERDQNKNIDVYTQFKRKLGTREEVYYTDVFRFYLRNKEQLQLTNEDVEHFKEIVFFNLNHNPLEGELTITNGQGSGTSYTMTRHMRLFPECLEIAKTFDWDLSSVQQNILNYIPCAYYEELKLIFECIDDVASLDLRQILTVYTDRQDDLAKLRPESFMRACEKYKILLAIPILEGFVNDENLLVQDRRLAIEVSNGLNPNTDKLRGYFENYRDIPENKKLAEKANELLIELNDKDAIEWRISEIKNRAFKVAPHEYGGGTRAIGEGESELHHKDFAKPLLNINSQDFYWQFIGLLDYSFDKVREHNEYWEYSSYIWYIVCNYIYNLRIYRKYESLLNLEAHIYEKAGEKGTNWFKYRIQKLKREYSSYISKPNDILTCIQQYNKIITNDYLLIKDDQGLISFIRTTINEDLRRFVEDEGYYREIEKVAGSKINLRDKSYLLKRGYDWLIQKAKGHQEDLIQKTLKVQLENAFLKKGLRYSDIIREPQLLDNTRIDFKISYGFLGPVLIETKTTSNREIRLKKERDAYKPKIIKYISGFNAVFSYFLIFQVSNTYPISKYKPELFEVLKE